MYTNEILARAVRGQAHGMSRQQDLIPLLNTVVQILYKAETPQSLLIDPSTGRIPVLATTQGSFGPYLGPVDTWRVANILVWSETYDRSDYGWSGTDLSDRINEYDEIIINGNKYYRFNYIRTEDALEGALPQMWFTCDPGTTTNYYYVQAYKNHPAITSDRIQLQIPDAGGAHQTIVVPGLIRLLQAQNNGDYMEAIEYIEQTLKPRLYAMMGKGAHGNRRQTTPRPW